MSLKKHRYPGSKPFTAQEKDIFFGREDDIERLTEMIRVEKLLVIYGKSGLGKSSLIHAGVVPKLSQTGDYEVFSVRLGSYQKEDENYHTPLFKLLRGIRLNRRKESFLNKKIHEDNYSLWGSLKGIQIAEDLDREFVIVLDQFEELFTYPDKDIRAFKEQLSELLSGKIPHKFRQILKEKMEGEPEILSKEEMTLLYKPLKIKIVMAIRSDKMSLLNRMRNYIPNILQKVYEVRPLTSEQAEDAILSPASITDSYEEFESPKFDYEDSALDKILAFLTKKFEKDVEAFQLQILCQYVEENIVIKHNDTSVSPDDLGDMEDIYQNYYDNQIAKITSQEDKTLARKLIEEDLIFAEEERRLSIYEGQIKRKGVSQELLTQLVDTHLLRAEPNPSGGYSYEISHDTLVPPILKSKERRLEEEQGKEGKKKLYNKVKYIGSIVLLIAVIGLGSSVWLNLQLEEARKKLNDKSLYLQEVGDSLTVQIKRYKDLGDSLEKVSRGSELPQLIDSVESKERQLSESQKKINALSQDTSQLSQKIAHIEEELNELLSNNNGVKPVAQQKINLLLKENNTLKASSERYKKEVDGEIRSVIHELNKLNENMEKVIYTLVREVEYQRVKKDGLQKYKQYVEQLERKLGKK